MVNVPSGLPETPALPNAPAAVPTPAEFAASRVGGIAGTLGALFAPAAVLGLTWMGFKAIVTGKSPFQKN
jgi:hypothetical protein